ncbi:MAG: AarF/ABC1/UbiB kinase family protein, partial [Alphaproteobacteria bacterium]
DGGGDEGRARLNLMDFGCVRVFSPSFVQGVVDLYYATRDNKRDLAIHAYEAWGFDDIANRPQLLEALNIWARFIYAPLTEDRVQPIVESHRVGAAGGEVAAKVHNAIRAAGGVKPPREFVLMDRSAIGLASVFSHLQAEVNWHRVFHDLADDFAPRELASRQAKALAGVGL